MVTTFLQNTDEILRADNFLNTSNTRLEYLTAAPILWMQ